MTCTLELLERPFRDSLFQTLSVSQAVWKTNVSVALCGQVTKCVGFVHAHVGREFRACCSVVVDPGSTGGQIGNRSSLFSFLLFRVLCRGTMQNYDTTETECAGNE